MSVKLENGMVVEIVSGEHKGKLGIVHGNTKIGPRIIVCIWQGMVYDTLVAFDEEQVVFYQNPHKLIRSLVVGDEMVILEELRIAYNTHSLRKKGQTLLIHDISPRAYSYGRIYYTHIATSNIVGNIPYQYVEESIDIQKTNKLLIKKYYSTEKNEPKLPLL